MTRHIHHLLAACLLLVTSALQALPAQRVGNLVVTDNADFSGATIDLATATLTFADGQIAQAKVTGLVSALDAKLDDSQATAFALTFLDDPDAASVRATIGLVIGTNVQAWSAKLDAGAALSGAIVGTTDTQTLTYKDLSSSTNTYRAATDTITGAVELATSAEAITGTDTARSMTPACDKAALGAFVYPVSLERVSRAMPYSDGATTNRASGIWTPGERGNLAGSAKATLFCQFIVPTTNPSANQYVQLLGTLASPIVSNGMLLRITSAGQLEVIVGGPTSSDYRQFRYSGFVSAYAGRFVTILFSITNGTADPAVSILSNGAAGFVDISSSFVTTPFGSVPDWLSSSLVCSAHWFGYGWPVGEAPVGEWGLGHWSTAEMAEYARSGRKPRWWVIGGSALDCITNGSFDADVTGWSAGIAGSIAWVAGELKLTSTSIGGVFSSTAGFTTIPGGRYVVSAKARRGTTNTSVQIRVSNASSLNGSLLDLYTTSTSTETLTGSFVATASVTYIGGRFPEVPAVVGSTGYFDDVVIKPDGACTIPRYQSIPVVDDASGIGGNAGRMVGMKTTGPVPLDWRIAARTATNGNEQLLGGAILDASLHVIDSIEQTPDSGTPTTTIGSASAGSQYKASSALTSGINVITPVTKKVATDSIWINSTTTDSVLTTIHGHSIK